MTLLLFAMKTKFLEVFVLLSNTRDSIRAQRYQKPQRQYAERYNKISSHRISIRSLKFFIRAYYYSCVTSQLTYCTDDRERFDLSKVTRRALDIEPSPLDYFLVSNYIAYQSYNLFISLQQKVFDELNMALKMKTSLMFIQL